MDPTDLDRVEEFEPLRPLLFSIAYRLLGSVGEAEDAVQETWLRFAASSTRPDSVQAYLSAIVTRISIDVLRSARVRREQYTGPWFPEPLLDDPYQDPARSAELADSVSMAALLLLERLSPLERAVFVLREVFGFGFAEVATAVGRSEAACRQLAVRARRHMAAGRPRFDTERQERDELAARFFGAFREGDVKACGTCSPPTSSSSATAVARHPNWPGPSAASTRSPGCWLPWPPCCRRSASDSNRTSSTANPARSSATGTAGSCIRSLSTSSTGRSSRFARSQPRQTWTRRAGRRRLGDRPGSAAGPAAESMTPSRRDGTTLGSRYSSRR